VTLSGRVHHFFTRVSSSNPQSCSLSYFVFDSLASRACSSESGNVDKELLNDIGNGLKNENTILQGFTTAWDMCLTRWSYS
jgi:hypothetical protein